MTMIQSTNVTRDLVATLADAGPGEKVVELRTGPAVRCRSTDETGPTNGRGALAAPTGREWNLQASGSVGQESSPTSQVRRHVCILYADAVGYARHMCEDEDAAQALVDQCLDIITVRILEHGGTVCHFAGDAVLARFPDANNALDCVLRAQAEIAASNVNLPLERRLLFRVGLHAARVMLSRGEIYGVGVNIAARLESFAPAGGICISEAFRRALRAGTCPNLRDLGERQLKHITVPVRAWQVELPIHDGSYRRASPLATNLFAELRSLVEPSPGLSAMRHLRLEYTPAGCTVVACVDPRFSPISDAAE
jgi:class 3 adenylate cyclase